MNYKTRANLPHNSDNYLYDILKDRGIENPHDYIEMCGSGIRQTDWRDLSQIDEAMPILLDAISGQYKIGIIADCDVDGYCSAAMTYLGLRDHNPNLNIKIYLHSGKAHGIDDEIMDDLMAHPVDILIIPDASSSELDRHKLISEQQTRILVIDHHLTEIENDPYCVRINNQISEGNVNKTLCGAGVVFFVLLALDDMKQTDYAFKYIDLCATALVADMMDLRNEETHYLVELGLSHIENSGIKNLLAANSYSMGNRTEVYPSDISFYIAPLINSIVRVGTANQKQILFDALVDGTRIVRSSKRGAKPTDTEVLGEQAARIAKNCKALQTRMVDRAMDILECKIAKNDLLSNKILLVPVTEEDDIPSTITGLVAMKLTALYHHPTMVLRECDDGVLKGSTRAESGTVIENFKEYVTNTGLVEYAEGHALANGVGIQESKIDEFLEYTNNNLADVDFNESFLTVDYIFTSSEDIADVIFDLDNGKNLWGQGVEECTFVVENIPLSSKDVKIMKNDCMKFTYNDVTYIIFKNPEAIEEFQANEKFSVTVYGKGSVNEWLGRRNAQVIIDKYDIQKRKYQF